MFRRSSRGGIEFREQVEAERKVSAHRQVGEDRVDRPVARSGGVIFVDCEFCAVRGGAAGCRRNPVEAVVVVEGVCGISDAVRGIEADAVVGSAVGLEVVGVDDDSTGGVLGVANDEDDIAGGTGSVARSGLDGQGDGFVPGVGVVDDRGDGEGRAGGADGNCDGRARIDVVGAHDGRPADPEVDRQGDGRVANPAEGRRPRNADVALIDVRPRARERQCRRIPVIGDRDGGGQARSEDVVRGGAECQDDGFDVLADGVVDRRDRDGGVGLAGRNRHREGVGGVVRSIDRGPRQAVADGQRRRCRSRASDGEEAGIASGFGRIRIRGHDGNRGCRKEVRRREGTVGPRGRCGGKAGGKDPERLGIAQDVEVSGRVEGEFSAQGDSCGQRATERKIRDAVYQGKDED